MEKETFTTVNKNNTTNFKKIHDSRFSRFVTDMIAF